MLWNSEGLIWLLCMLSFHFGSAPGFFMLICVASALWKRHKLLEQSWSRNREQSRAGRRGWWQPGVLWFRFKCLPTWTQALALLLCGKLSSGVMLMFCWVCVSLMTSCMDSIFMCNSSLSACLCTFVYTLFLPFPFCFLFLFFNKNTLCCRHVPSPQTVHVLHFIL